MKQAISQKVLSVPDTVFICLFVIWELRVVYLQATVA